MGYLKASKIRRDRRNQVSPEAIAALERHIDKILEDADDTTDESGKQRITGPIMRRCLNR